MLRRSFLSLFGYLLAPGLLKSKLRAAPLRPDITEFFALLKEVLPYLVKIRPLPLP